MQERRRYERFPLDNDEINISNDSEYVNVRLEYLDIQEEDQAKLERVIDSLC